MTSKRALRELGRWLGPWSGDRVPPRIRREHLSVMGASDRVFRASIYLPEIPPIGAYFVAPGLHYLGPDDARFDRFCRILAAAGFLVMAPLIPAFQALVLHSDALVDARAAFSVLADRAEALSLSKPAIFSISFGSSLAFDIASHSDTRERVGGMAIFGGFCDFVPTVRFAVTGVAHRSSGDIVMPNDPLNSPVVYLNVLSHLPVDGDKRVLAEAWRTMVYRTWNRTDLKAIGARDPFAHELSRRLPESLRQPFLWGCGLGEGRLEWLEKGLEKAAADLSFMDPVPRLPNLSARTMLVHGRDDDVIPYVETEKLGALIPPHLLAGQFITGLYGHTAVESVTVGAVFREVAKLAGMLQGLERAPRGAL